MIVIKTSTQHKNSAAFGGGLLRLFFCLLYNHFLRVQNQICTYWVYLMEHIFFELQLCIEILIFKEKSNFGYTDHPEITTSLKPVDFICRFHGYRIEAAAWHSLSFYLPRKRGTVKAMAIFSGNIALCAIRRCDAIQLQCAGKECHTRRPWISY